MSSLPFVVDPSMVLEHFWEQPRAPSKLLWIHMNYYEILDPNTLKAIYTRQLDFIREDDHLSEQVRETPTMLAVYFKRDVYDFGHLMKNAQVPLAFLKCIINRYDLLPQRKSEFGISFFEMAWTKQTDIASLSIAIKRFDVLEFLIDECGLKLQYKVPDSDRWTNHLFIVAFMEGSVRALRIFKEYDLYSEVVNPCQQIIDMMSVFYTTNFRSKEHEESVMACFHYLFEEIGWDLRENEDHAARVFYSACRFLRFGKPKFFEKIRRHLLFDPESMTLNLPGEKRESLIYLLGRDRRFEELKYINTHFIHPVVGQSHELDALAAGIINTKFHMFFGENKSKVLEEVVRDLVSKGVRLNSRLPDGKSTLTWASLCKCIPAERLMDLFEKEKIDVCELSVQKLNVCEAFDTIWQNKSAPFLLEWKKRVMEEEARKGKKRKHIEQSV